jgi:hypothetical protein
MSDASLIVTFTVDLGAEVTYRYQDIHRSTQKITELVPGRKSPGQPNPQEGAAA